MKKIKIVGAFVFILSITLAVLFNYTHKKSVLHNSAVSSLNSQKDFTQEISKNIFYIYKDKDYSNENLNSLIKTFLNNMKNQDNTLEINKKIVTLWNEFYLHVQNFRNHIKSPSPYSDIILQKCVKDIYATNLKLIIEFDKLVKSKQNIFDKEQSLYKIIQYALFIILVLLLLYLFSQLNSVINFIQKFVQTSKSIITNSTIKELKPIEISDKNNDISEAKDNFNALIEKINSSVANSTASIEYSYNSLKIIEAHIEELVEFIYTMNENKRDKGLIQKEDAVIQSLEELSRCARELKNLKNDLDNLISHSNSNLA